MSKTNAPVLTPVTWASPQDQTLFTGACADGLSNQTVRPCYEYLAPSSWLRANTIPPHDYQFMHTAARLDDAQTEELITALKNVITQ